MRNIIVLIISFSLLACNPFISKDLRKKNRANRKLAKVIKKYPELLNKDTTIVNFDTTIVTTDVKVDTVLSTNFDTLKIVRDKFHLKLIKTTDTLIIDGGCLSDTIYIDKEILVPIDVVKPVQLTIAEQVLNGLGRFWWWILIAIILIFATEILSKRLF